jgi:hypothetical protein
MREGEDILDEPDPTSFRSQSSASVCPSTLPSAGEVPMKFRVFAAHAISVLEPSHHKQHASAIVSSEFPICSHPIATKV